MKWLQATVATTTEGSDLVASVMYDLGSDGVSIIDSADVKDLIENKQNWDYVDDNLLKMVDNKAFVSGFFAEDFDVSAIVDALSELSNISEFPMGSMELSTSVIASEDWENEWRKYYSPIKIGKVVIVPAWQKYETDGDELPVYIEPGMAFGTGNHETTSMCIELMQLADVNGKTAADIGCGSGILGISALKLGASRCVFNDIDELAITATKDNAKLNGLNENCTFIAGDLDVGGSKSEVVLANLTADLLLRLKNLLSDVACSGGQIIVSGIINSRAEEVYEAYSKELKPVKIIRRGEWQAMLFEKL